jgi:hypothetical protein
MKGGTCKVAKVRYLSEIPFKTSFDFDEKTVDKAIILYEMGIIGLLIGKEEVATNGFGCRYCYSYNEGMKPLDIIKNNFNPEENKINFIFNPLFCKYLLLNMNTQDIIGDFGWDYLNKNHQRKMVIQRF